MISVRRGSPNRSLISTQFTLDDLEDLGLAGENLLETLDQREDLLVLIDDLVPFETGQAMQAHVENCLGLNRAQVEAGNQPFFGFGRIGTGLDRSG